MIDLDSHLTSLVNRGLVAPEEAVEKSQAPIELRKRLRAAGITVGEVEIPAHLQ
jgi:twitching motility protein PilT